MAKTGQRDADRVGDALTAAVDRLGKKHPNRRQLMRAVAADLIARGAITPGGPVQVDPDVLDRLTTNTGRTAADWKPALDKLDSVADEYDPVTGESRADQIVAFCAATGMGPDAVDGLLNPAPPAA